MRTLYISAILFIVMISGMIFSIKYLEHTCNDLKAIELKIESSINDGTWKNSDAYSSEFMDKWGKTSDNISVFVDHKEMDNINVELWKLTEYIKCRNKEESLASVHTISFFIDHIRNMEHINVQNIF